GSSKMVARSRAHSSPACDPSGVTLTFWADAADVAATTARKNALAAKCLMAPPVNASRGNVSRVLPTCWFDSICDLLHRVSRLELICSAYNWLRVLALNQWPLGDEQPAMTDNPLILWERRSPAGRSTCSVLPVSGCRGSKMGADNVRRVRRASQLQQCVWPSCLAAGSTTSS